ncbi:ATP synthase subunit b, mitochondrial-like, partial [Daphnia pulex]|uniref:ATP synthase subunit b, mitochondrial-like n=1 Tax=Daphnia pulex TaxID=6669 RepID=UPI001EDD9E4B
MGFIPCIALKSGPYTFRLGLATYLCSKTIYIMEHEFYAGLSIAIMGVYAVKKLGSGTAKFLDAEVSVSEIIDPFLAPHLKFPMLIEIWTLKNPNARIATGKIEQDRALAMKMLFDAVNKRKNVALQLEAAYREQLRNPR